MLLANIRSMNFKLVFKTGFKYENQCKKIKKNKNFGRFPIPIS